MKTLYPIRYFIAALVLAGIPAFSMSAAKNEAQVPAKASAEVDRQGRKTIFFGMTADEVRELIGKPAAIKRMKTESGKAEIWVYTYCKVVGSTQAATSMRNVETFCGASKGVQMVQQPVYSVVNRKAEETTELLMVDGSLVNWKRYRTLNRDFQ